LLVPGTHNYAVSTAGILVHNKADVAARTVFHHVFPQQFWREFEKIFARSGESIHDYTIEIPESLHQSIHPEWNYEWEDFFASRSRLPSAAEVKDFASEMVNRYGLEQYLPLVPYPQR